MNFIKLFSKSESRNRRQLDLFARVQSEFTGLVLNTLPDKYTQLKGQRDELDLLLNRKTEIESVYPNEFYSYGLRPEYKNERKRRRIIVSVATLLEGIATGLTLNMMLGTPTHYAIVVGLALAFVVFVGASAERVASKELKSRWMWIILAAYNIILAGAGLWMGLKANTDAEYMILHVLISCFSFSIILIALRHSDKIDRDKLIAGINKEYKKVLAAIDKFQKTLSVLKVNLRKEMSNMKAQAIRIFDYYVQFDRDDSNLKMAMLPILVVNQVFRQDVLPVPQGPMHLTDVNPQSSLSEIFKEFGNHSGSTSATNNVAPIDNSLKAINQLSTIDSANRTALTDETSGSSQPQGSNPSSNNERPEKIGGIHESETEL